MNILRWRYIFSWFKISGLFIPIPPKSHGWRICFGAICAVFLFSAALVFAEPIEERVIFKLVTSGWNREIAEKIAQKILHSPGRKVAVFDHDGTLIQGDICEGDGESQPGIIKDLISRNRLKPEGEAAIPPGFKRNVWESYKEWVELDTKAAYAWFPNLLAGFSVPEAQMLAKEYYQKVYRNFIFPEIKSLIEVLKDAGVDVYVISASPDVFVKEASPWIGIDSSHIFGVNLKVHGNGKISGVRLPISFAEGKTYYIRKLIGTFSPGNILVFGDSYRTDGHMLRFSARQQGIAVLVNPAKTLLPTLHREGIFQQRFKKIPSTQ